MQWRFQSNEYSTTKDTCFEWATPHSASQPCPCPRPPPSVHSLKPQIQSLEVFFNAGPKFRRLCFRLVGRKIGDNLFLTKRGGRKNERREREERARGENNCYHFTSFSPRSLVSSAPSPPSSSSSLIAAKLLFLAREMGNFYAREKERAKSFKDGRREGGRHGATDEPGT